MPKVGQKMAAVEALSEKYGESLRYELPAV